MTGKIPAISLFDVTGPIMTGPSSSHTAGAVRIGLMGRQIMGGEPCAIKILFYGSLAETYKGHMTDSGVVGGLMGLSVDDPKIRSALGSAGEKTISVEVETHTQSDKNPNTIEMKLSTPSYSADISALTVGGGEILIQEINGFPVELRGKKDVLLLWGEEGLVDGSLPSLRSDPAYEREACSSKGRDKMYIVHFSQAPSKDSLSSLEKNIPSGDFRYLQPLYDYQLRDPEPSVSSIREVLAECNRSGINLPEVAILYESRRSGLPGDRIREKFNHIWNTMQNSIDHGITGHNDMVGGLMGGKDALKMQKAWEEGRLVSGAVLSLGVTRAIAAMESNASMGRVVAAPTAGSCGVVPGIFSSVSEKYSYPLERITEGLLVASLFGVLVAMRAPVSGALGGCQSEIGVASAMAAAGLAQMAGGSPTQVSQAFALAMKNILGLVCDPVAGPVEVPCIKRNAIGVANALAACDMALAGIVSIVPPDEVIDALINVQQLLPMELRDTTLGGLGATPTGVRLKKEWLSKCSRNTCDRCSD
ncbi:MAG: L-serine ammonia-lyase, iron-sulfur-dependent, subunit alpha [Synergistales bacterium]|nr:L-serine ammonia-lyase, iron-sulfur-dependent, subunit alpha [Synergistales bacterium]